MTHCYAGFCPVCEKDTRFISASPWLRDNLFCENCSSIPRERAFALCLSRVAPEWPRLRLHECSPADRAVSSKLRAGCKGYVSSQYFPGIPRGTLHQGHRSEDLEALTFADGSLDLHCHLDVLEHVNRPARCFAEMERSLAPGGRMIFTTPYHQSLPTTERRAYYSPTGPVHLATPPEYHGNPIDEKGALVTFRYGCDLPELIRIWAPSCTVEMITYTAPEHGILGTFREVFVVTKAPARASPGTAPHRAGLRAQASAR